MRFWKMNGAGNDFVVLDDREDVFSAEEGRVAELCRRRSGIGADGLMCLSRGGVDVDFRMDYYNSDGRLGSMCGNGGRCIAAFAYMLGLGRDGKLTFDAYDGRHDAEVLEWDGRKGVVNLGMRDVEKRSVRSVEGGKSLDTGSPHFVIEVDDVESVDVEREGRMWRNRTDLFSAGANIDFVERVGERLKVRTYERGVEAETWACGTGVTACALACGVKEVEARGGSFRVEYEEEEDRFTKIRLVGPVELNFVGEVEV